MTIFDTLRYSISDPPTQEELEALPHWLLQNWAEEQFTILRSTSIISNHLKTEKDFCEYRYRRLINSLKKAILEYDSPRSSSL